MVSQMPLFIVGERGEAREDSLFTVQINALIVKRTEAEG